MLAVSLLGAAALPSRAQQQATTLKEIVEKGLAFLQEEGQAEDGTFSARAGSGITALAITAALRNGREVDDPLVVAGLKAMEGFVKPDGGIYGSDRLRNYETCVGIVCFNEANADGRYNEILKNAEAFVRGLQYGEAGDVDQSDPWFGGVGYGGPERPDLSNTTYLVDALHELEATSDDPAIQRALVFASRCQNLEGHGNDTEFAGLVDDGGFYYVVPKEKVDPSSDERYTANGGLRSYGSMTYSGFKSMVYAGLTKDDPRVKAALQWIGENYSVEKNPGQGTAGLFYYYNTFATALQASGLNEIPDGKGAEHNWRADLVAELGKRQQADGSWKNENQMWFENDPNLCTAFALLALACCDESADGQP